MNEVFRLFGSIGLKTDEAEKGLDSTVDKAKGSGSKISGTFKKAAVAIGGFFAAGKVIEFGKMAVEAAASAQAIESQFQQVFGSSQKTATGFIDGMAKEFGMLSTRIKPSFTSATSMFKGLGASTAEAMGLAKKSVTAAADAAAFYDKSYEDASGAINSFLKGNYEAGESVGIFANDTQMAQFAISKGVVGSTAEWQKLDEKTKQATRLEYVQNMQKQSGAMGQAAREADGYENVMGNVKQAWQDFLTIVGKPVLNLAVSGLKGVSGALKAAGGFVKDFTKTIGDLWNSFTKTDAFKSLQTGLDNTKQAFQTFGDFIKTTWDYITGLFTMNDPLKNLKMGEKLSKMVPDSVVSDIRDKVTSIRDKFDEIQSTVDGVIGVVTGKFKSLGDLQNAFGDIFSNSQLQAIKRFGDGIKDTIDKIKQIFSDAGKKISDAFGPFLKEHGPAIKKALDNIVNIVKTMLIPSFLMIGSSVYNAFNIVRAVIDNFGDLFGGIVDIVKGVLELIIGIFSADGQTVIDAFGDIWNGAIELLKGIFGTIWDIIKGPFVDLWNVISPHVEQFGQSIADFFSGLWQGISDVAKTVWDVISNFFTTAWNGIVNTAKTVFTPIANFFSNLWNGISNVAKTVWNAVSSFLSGLWNGIKNTATTVFNAIKSVVTNIWNGIKSVTTSVWNGIKNTISSVWAGIKSVVSTAVNGIKSTVTNVWTGIKNVTKTVWDGIKSLISTPINGAKSVVKKAIDAIKGFFNFKISWPHIPLPHFSIKGSANPLDWIKKGVPKIGLDFYAKGGILSKATAFGVNGSNMMVGGEAGKEAILPLNKNTLGGIGKGIVDNSDSTDSDSESKLDQMINLLSELLDETIAGGDVILDDGTLVGKLGPKISKQISDEGQKKNYGKRGKKRV